MFDCQRGLSQPETDGCVGPGSLGSCGSWVARKVVSACTLVVMVNMS